MGGLNPYVASPRLYSQPKGQPLMTWQPEWHPLDYITKDYIPVGAMGAMAQGATRRATPAGGGRLHSREGSQGAIVSPLG